MSALNKYLLLLLFFISSFLSSSAQINPLKIEFNSKSFVEIHFLNVSEPIQLQFDYYPYLHLTRLQTPEYTVENDTIVIVPFTTHMPQKHLLKIADLNIPVFLPLADTIQIEVDLLKKVINYSGIYSHINTYYLSVNEHLQNNFYKLGQVYGNDTKPWLELYEQMDSIASSEKNLLLNTSIPLPDWFKKFENKRIEFRTAEYKLSGPSYRNFLNKKATYIPEKETYTFLEGLDLNSSYNRYLTEFYSFMNFYSSFKIFGKYYVVRDSALQLFNNKELANEKFKIFEGEVEADNLIVFEIDNTLDDISRNSIRKENRINYLISKYGEDNSFLRYLLEVDQEYGLQRLSKGDKAPYFYLDDSNGHFIGLDTYKGKLVLLNFFIKGCKPCFKEIPHEKRLLNKYKTRNFEVINICVTNSISDFHKAVEQFEMEGINVYTQGQWINKIKSDYNIVGYPQYCLIDANGIVVMNHAFKPSNPELEKLIKANLSN